MSEEALDLKELLERVQDDKELTVELLDIFVEDYRTKRKNLNEAIGKKDFEEIKNITHALKGASGNISAKAVREILIQLETMGKNENIEGSQGLLSQLDKAFEELKERIKSVKEDFK
jgi:two-component system, sensor histidine kinase and response regulator